MKNIKNINIASDGSLYFSYRLESALNNKLVNFQKQDEKSFSLNQKKQKRTLDSKYSSYHKKKIFKIELY